MKVIYVVFVLVFAVTVLCGQNPSTPNPSTANSATSNSQTNAQPSTGSPSKVLCAIKLPDPSNPPASATAWQKVAQTCSNSEKNNSDQNPDEGLNDRLYLILSVTDSHLHTAENKVAALEKFTFAINGVVVPDAKLTWEDKNDGVASAELARTANSKLQWNTLLAQKLHRHTVAVTLHDPDDKPLDSCAYFNLQVFRFRWYALVLLGIIFVLLIVLWTNDRLREMLRDDGEVKPDPAGQPRRRAYSLARVQMAYWFAITILCYIAIWLITGDRNTINDTVLGLIGISAGTALGAVAIDSSKKSQAASDLVRVQNNLATTQATVAALPAGSPAQVVGNQTLALQQAAAQQLRDRTYADYHEGFLNDILCDEDGPSFHRFQIFAWTLVLGVIFIASVVQTLDMPNFSTTLLALMGISGGTYLGFKFPEQKTP